VIFRQYYLGCLSHASYLVADETTGDAVVVDPQRDVSGYLQDAGEHSLKIRHVIETHLHADFVSGHLELAAATGADICYGQGVETSFPVRALHDGERISLGQVELEVRATPGHTPESISVVVRERGGAEPWGVLTGDTLFVGDVGRPDLTAGVDPGVTVEGMARELYRSLWDKLLTLPDATRVFPAHGAGSACGKNLSTETSSTIGEQRGTNHALRLGDEDAFIAAITEGQPARPHYFAYDASRNREARTLLDEHTVPPALSLDEVLAVQAGGGAVLDTRPPQEFALAHLRGSINVGLEGRFAEYAGDVLDPGTPVVLVAEDDHCLEAKVRLARIGFDAVAGCLDRPLAAFAEHPELTERSSRLRADELAGRLGSAPGLVVLDVRNPGELAQGAIPGARSIPLPRLLDGMGDLDPQAVTVVYCAGGYRSSIAASLLASRGWRDVSDLLGGYAAWEALGG
jgi:glyoxylase-like metal-dependent hydrolase (beta-lactamase superfamily II)/rhodanese-related sulfurtransferase